MHLIPNHSNCWTRSSWHQSLADRKVKLTAKPINERIFHSTHYGEMCSQNLYANMVRLGKATSCLQSIGKQSVLTWDESWSDVVGDPDHAIQNWRCSTYYLVFEWIPREASLSPLPSSAVSSDASSSHCGVVEQRTNQYETAWYIKHQKIKSLFSQRRKPRELNGIAFRSHGWLTVSDRIFSHPSCIRLSDR